MKYTLATMALAATAAASPSHSGLHKRAHAKDMAKRSGLVANALISVLPAAVVSNPVVKLGADSSYAYEHTIVNNANEDVFLAFWQGEQFNLPLTPYNPNPAVPLMTVTVPKGENQTVSLSSEFNGAYTTVWSDSLIGAGGNIAEPYIEITGGQWGTFDYSRLPNMNSAHHATIEMEGCSSTPDTCAYVCKPVAGVTPANCWEAGSYDLINCSSAASNPGIDSLGQPAGGCQIGAQGKFTTTFTDASSS